MDRRSASLALLLLFVLCTGVAIVVGGSRPGLEQGVAPTVVQFVGYLLALAAAVLLLASPTGGPDGGARGIGGTVLGAVVVLVLVEFLGGGTGIAAGLVRLIALVVIMVATVRIALGVASAGRTR